MQMALRLFTRKWLLAFHSGTVGSEQLDQTVKILSTKLKTSNKVGSPHGALSTISKNARPTRGQPRSEQPQALIAGQGGGTQGDADQAGQGHVFAKRPLCALQEKRGRFVANPTAPLFTTGGCYSQLCLNELQRKRCSSSEDAPRCFSLHFPMIFTEACFS